jgi:hypothetical protein
LEKRSGEYAQSTRRRLRWILLPVSCCCDRRDILRRMKPATIAKFVPAIFALTLCGAAQCQSISVVVRDVKGKPVRDLIVIVERDGETANLVSDSAGEYSSAVAPGPEINMRWSATAPLGDTANPAADGTQVFIRVYKVGFEAVEIKSVVPYGSQSCKADVTLVKGKLEATPDAGTLICTPPPPSSAPYAAMLTFRIGLGITEGAFMELQPLLPLQINKLMNGGSSYTSMFADGAYTLQVTPPAHQPVWIAVLDAPQQASWTLSNPDVAVLTKVDPKEGRIEFAKDGGAVLTLTAPGAAADGTVILRVQLNALTSNGMWQVTASRVTENGALIDMNGNLVKQ